MSLTTTSSPCMECVLGAHLSCLWGPWKAQPPLSGGAYEVGVQPTARSVPGKPGLGVHEGGVSRAGVERHPSP